MRRSPLIVPLVSLAVSFLPSVASAHISLTYPPPRYADLKKGPCGKGGALDVRGANVTKLKPGATITVTWKETIGHPGHYRIAFDPNGQSIFQDPKSFSDVSGGPGVLMDGIADKTGTQTYSQQVTLPNVECTNCTLQVIQVMTDKVPYGDGDDIYYQCADIVLAKDALDDAGTFPYPDGGSSGSSGTPAYDGGIVETRDPDAGAAATAEEGGCAVGSANEHGPLGVGGTMFGVLGAVWGFKRFSRRKQTESAKPQPKR
ncbi:MAG: SCE4755 family polysaccharide monooxygenase-like protein [Polyangiaceae bacterium]